MSHSCVRNAAWCLRGQVRSSGGGKAWECGGYRRSGRYFTRRRCIEVARNRVSPLLRPDRVGLVPQPGQKDGGGLGIAGLCSRHSEFDVLGELQFLSADHIPINLEEQQPGMQRGPLVALLKGLGPRKAFDEQRGLGKQSRARIVRGGFRPRQRAYQPIRVTEKRHFARPPYHTAIDLADYLRRQIDDPRHAG